MPPTDQDQPRRANVNVKARSPVRGVPIVQPTFDDRDRRKSDSAGGLVSSKRASSHYESWEDCSTPPQTDAELYRAIRHLGIDIEKLGERIMEKLKEMSADQDEQRVAFMQVMTRMLDRVLEDKKLEVTSTVKVQEAGAMANIESRSEDFKLKRKIAWKWWGSVLAVAFASLVSALIARYI